jgi:hypothetical protein
MSKRKLVVGIPSRTGLYGLDELVVIPEAAVSLVDEAARFN